MPRYETQLLAIPGGSAAIWLSSMLNSESHRLNARVLSVVPWNTGQGAFMAQNPETLMVVFELPDSPNPSDAS